MNPGARLICKILPDEPKEIQGEVSLRMNETTENGQSILFDLCG